MEVRRGCRTGPACNRTGHHAHQSAEHRPGNRHGTALAARVALHHDLHHHGFEPDTAGAVWAMSKVACARNGTLYNYQVSGADSCAQVLSLGPSGGGLTLAGKS